LVENPQTVFFSEIVAVEFPPPGLSTGTFESPLRIRFRLGTQGKSRLSSADKIFCNLPPSRATQSDFVGVMLEHVELKALKMKIPLRTEAQHEDLYIIISHLPSRVHQYGIIS
jgi:hypothetical protein